MMNEAQLAIADKRYDLETEEKKLRNEALKAVSAQIKPLKVALYEECERMTGHRFEFNNYNYNNTFAWYKCKWCGCQRGQDEMKNLDNTPWSDELVKKLNESQKDLTRHPYTCPGDYKECANQRELIATNNGWVCQCGKYTTMIGYVSVANTLRSGRMS